MHHLSISYETLQPDRHTSKRYVALISDVHNHLDRSDFAFVVTCSPNGHRSYFLSNIIGEKITGPNFDALYRVGYVLTEHDLVTEQFP